MVTSELFKTASWERQTGALQLPFCPRPPEDRRGKARAVWAVSPGHATEALLAVILVCASLSRRFWRVCWRPLLGKGLLTLSLNRLALQSSLELCVL